MRDDPRGRHHLTSLVGGSCFVVRSERIKSDLTVAKMRGKKLGRQPGQRSKFYCLAPKFMVSIAKGRRYRCIARDPGISKSTVLAIAKP
ncbi:MAG: recombinase family protein [Pseudomonadota bacterium]